MDRAIEVRVDGWVQGVGFRYATLTEARRLGLSGWVRNEVAGAVTVWVQGETEVVDRLSAWLRHGPPGAKVQDFRLTERQPDPALTGFNIRH